MKNLIILGSARSGKSTFSKMVSEKFNINLIAMDSIVAAFQASFKDIGINHKNTDCEQIFAPFLKAYLKDMLDYKKFVCEGSLISPQCAKQSFNDLDCIIIAFGIPSLSVDAAVKNMKLYDDEDSWSYWINDDELKELAENGIRKSKKILVECSKLKIPFF